MAATQPPPETRLWNSGSQPLVPHQIGWGNGAVPPGGSFLTAAPESYGPPWIMDPEADQRLQQEQQALDAAQGAQEARSAVPAPKPTVSVTAPPSAPVAPQNASPTQTASTPPVAAPSSAGSTSAA